MISSSLRPCWYQAGIRHCGTMQAIGHLADPALGLSAAEFWCLVRGPSLVNRLVGPRGRGSSSLPATAPLLGWLRALSSPPLPRFFLRKLTLVANGAAISSLSGPALAAASLKTPEPFSSVCTVPGPPMTWLWWLLFVQGSRPLGRVSRAVRAGLSFF